MTEKLKIVKLIHLAISAGVMIVYVLMGDLISFESLRIPKINASNAVYLLIPLLSISVSFFLYKTQVKQVDSNLKLEEKIPHYQTATLIRLAVLEAGAFLILFLKPDFILFGIILVLCIIVLRPSEKQFRKDFEGV